MSCSHDQLHEFMIHEAPDEIQCQPVIATEFPKISKDLTLSTRVGEWIFHHRNPPYLMNVSVTSWCIECVYTANLLRIGETPLWAITARQAGLLFVPRKRVQIISRVQMNTKGVWIDKFVDFLWCDKFVFTAMRCFFPHFLHIPDTLFRNSWCSKWLLRVHATIGGQIQNGAREKVAVLHWVVRPCGKHSY